MLIALSQERKARQQRERERDLKLIAEQEAIAARRQQARDAEIREREARIKV